MKFPAICVLLLSGIISLQYARAADAHLRYFTILNQPDAGHAKQEFAAALADSSELNREEILFLRTCLAYVTWNNHEKGSGRLMDLNRKEIDKLTHPPELPDAYLVMAYYYLTTWQEQELAEKYLIYTSSILSAHFTADNFRYGIYYFLKGLLNVHMYDHVNAIQYFNRSIKLITTYPALREYYFQNYLGMLDAMTFLQYKTKPLQVAAKCIDECNSEGRSSADFYLRKSNYYSKMKDSLNSLKEVKKGLIRVRPGSAVNSSVKSLLYYGLGTLVKGNKRLEYYDKAIRIAESFENNEWLTFQILLDFALHYYENADYEKCLKYAQKTLIAGSYDFKDTSVFSNPALKQIRPFYLMIETLGLKGNAFIRWKPRWDYNDKLWIYNNLDNSLEAVQLASALTDRFLNRINDENSGFSIIEHRKRILNNESIYAIMAFGQTNDMKYARQAFTASEKCKMQMLRMRISQKARLEKAGIPDTLISRVEILQNNILQFENQIAMAEKKGRGDVKTLTAKLTGLYDQRDRLNYDMNQRYPFTVEYNREVCSVNEVQKYLAQDQVLVAYSMTLYEIIIYTITKDSFYVKPVLIDGAFLSEIEKMRDLISVNPLNCRESQLMPFCKTSGYLYHYLIAPVYDLIKGKHLIVVPHNELTLIPFEVLMPYSPEDPQPLDFGSLPYLIREFPVSYAYSATFLLENRQTEVMNGKGTGIFVPDYKKIKTDTVFNDLSGAREEARYLNRFMNSKMFRSIKANEYEFKIQAQRFSILHISSHTLIDEDNPGLSCLVLHENKEHKQDGYLYAYELSEMKLNARLVMLSGCNTGYGKLRLSEGLVSIARSFFYTGVRTVGFTLWNVADQSAAKLTGFFYDGLRHRQPLDVAMRNSKMKFIENSDPVRAHPYFWANYIIVGSTDGIALRKVPISVKIGASILVPLLIFLLVIKFRKKAG
jgi:CHAT domain-containing protein/tetratricopeptide (TPR) repeat protein